MYICEFVFPMWFPERRFIAPHIFILVIRKASWRRELCNISCHLSLLIKSMLHWEASCKNSHVTGSSLSRHTMAVCQYFLICALSVALRHFESVIPVETEAGSWSYNTTTHKTSHFSHTLLGLCLRNEFESTMETKLKGSEATVQQSSEVFILIQ